MNAAVARSHGERLSFRPDVEGLRAIAVLLVVGFHAGVPGLDNGFVGVDVFFVLSGFLITRQLLAEGASGTIDLKAFWARRARRLLPAAALMTGSVCAAAFFFLSPLQWSPLAREIGASAAFLANIWFLLHTKGYFEANVELRPLLHTWSLSVEEQFYLVWPAILLLTFRMRRSPRTAILAVVTVSFVLSALLSPGRPAAFFGPHTRFWEMAVGAGVAVWECRAPPASAGRRRALLAFGAIGLGATLVVLHPNVAWPGTAALLPVGSTAALLVGGRGSASGVLGLQPLQWLGRLSYGWYLWHWPAIRFAEANGGSVAVAVVASLLAAMASHALVEAPVRHHPRWASSPALTLKASAVLVAAVLAGAAMLEFAARAQLESDRLKRLVAARRDYAAVPDCDRWQEWGATPPPSCTFGNPQGSMTILVIGDSHAAHWLGAIEPFARTRDARIVFSGVKACPAAPVAVRWDKLPGKRYAACDAWQSGLSDLLAKLRPSLIIAASNDDSLDNVIDAGGRVVERQDAIEMWRTGLSRLAQLAAGHLLVVVMDAPAFREDPIDCLATNGECSMGLTDALAPLAEIRRVQREVLVPAGVHLIDGAAIAFPEGIMRAEIDDVVTYRDRQHLTRAFSVGLAERMGAELAQVLVSRSRHEPDSRRQGDEGDSR